MPSGSVRCATAATTCSMPGAGVQQPLGRLDRVERAELEGGGAERLDVVVGHQPGGACAVEPGRGGHRADGHRSRRGRERRQGRGGGAARPEPLGQPSLTPPHRYGRCPHDLAGGAGGPGELDVVEGQPRQGAVSSDDGGRGVDQHDGPQPGRHEGRHVARLEAAEEGGLEAWRTGCARRPAAGRRPAAWRRTRGGGAWSLVSGFGSEQSNSVGRVGAPWPALARRARRRCGSRTTRGRPRSTAGRRC